MPSTPCSRQSLASSAVRIPFTSSGTLTILRISSRYCHVYQSRAGGHAIQTPAPSACLRRGSAAAGPAGAAAEIPIVLGAFVERGLLIDRDHDRRAAGVLRLLQNPPADGAVLLRIELRPERTLRCGGHLVDGGARDVAQDHRRVRGRGRPAMHPDLSIRMQRHLHGRRRHDDRILHPGAEHLGGKIHALRIDGLAGYRGRPTRRPDGCGGR